MTIEIVWTNKRCENALICCALVDCIFCPYGHLSGGLVLGVKNPS